MSTWGSRVRDQRGAAAVETALCLCFVVLPLVFATVSYAYMLTFRQTVSQSVAEGARAAALAPAGSTNAVRQAAAVNAINQSMSTGVGSMTCGTNNLTCTVSAPAVCASDATKNCVTVVVSYPYRDHSLLPSIPGLGFTLPATISYSAQVEVS